MKTLKECGYRWLLVQEHTVERAEDGGPVRQRPPPAPARRPQLARRDASSIIAIIKTQGSDTKLVGQMQPYYEAQGLGRDGARRASRSRRSSPRSPTAKTAA